MATNRERCFTMSRFYRCERCGGIGRQPDGCWNGESYAAVAGVCDDCNGVGMLGFTEVDRAVFFERINPIDCHPQIVNARCPYTAQFTTRNGLVIGASVETDDEKTRFFLPLEKTNSVEPSRNATEKPQP
jgi:hypothetical protein